MAAFYRLLLGLLWLQTLRLVSHFGVIAHPKKFRGAVYEHTVIFPPSDENISRVDALKWMQKNLDVYAQQTTIAREQGADIIVFPEDGVYGTIFPTRDSILPFLETIPDPKHTLWSPCDEPLRFEHTEVQRALSCMAKENFIYVVANIGDKQNCDNTDDIDCPSDGRYQFNTAVAFGPGGQLLARYHKYNLFFEEQFNTPEPEAIFFDTPFGRFGLFICFDALFYNPAISMYEKHNITNVAFPTAWMDALPLLSAVGFHSSIARGLGVNYLSANIHRPSKNFHGSGIYTPKGEAAFYYNNSLQSESRLLVADLKILEKPQHQDVNSENGLISDIYQNEFESNEEQAMLELEQRDEYSRASGGNSDNVFDSNNVNNTFTSQLFYDNFTFTSLVETSGLVKVCQNKVCCHLNYSIDTSASVANELFAFGVFDGLHTKDGQYYFQICALVKCAADNDTSSCGSPTLVSNTMFSYLQIRGKFQNNFVYPQIVLTSDKNLKLASQKAWTFHRSKALLSASSMSDPLITAALISRVYSRDPENSIHSYSASAATPSLVNDRKHQLFKYLTVTLAVMCVVSLLVLELNCVQQ